MSEPIDYAAPDVPSGRPPFVPDPGVEAMLDRNAPFGEIARAFWVPGRAVRYVERSIADRFAASRAGRRCVACGGPTDDLVYASWRFAHDGRSYRGRTETCHAMCATCAIRWRWRAFGATIAFGLRATLTACAIASLGVGLLLARTSKSRAAATGIGIGLIALTSVLIWIEERVLPLAVPPALRAIVPSMLSFAGWDGSATRGPAWG